MIGKVEFEEESWNIYIGCWIIRIGGTVLGNLWWWIFMRFEERRDGSIEFLNVLVISKWSKEESTIVIMIVIIEGINLNKWYHLFLEEWRFLFCFSFFTFIESFYIKDHLFYTDNYLLLQCWLITSSILK